MITKLRGDVREVQDMGILMDVHGVVYEILMAPSILAEVRRPVDWVASIFVEKRP